MSTTLVNCTPHAINIKTENGTVSVPASGNVARVETTVVPVSELDNGVQIVKTVFNTDKVTGLPEPKEGTFYIVSLITLQALEGIRNDLFAPGNLIRDKEGNIVGCDGLTVA